MINICNRIITFSFYALFFTVPLVFTDKTSELFELNKMWITWALTIIITAAWLTKMVLQKRIAIRKTPLDIPIGLFLLSQIISTFISLDPHVSLWGYYSRFNGGLLSTISYILLYYAFVSNLDKKQAIYSLYAGFLSCVIVALWGFPAHFGADPTCYLFRGNFDVSCWTEAFQPKVRIFSTLGQPNWMATYLSIFLVITMAMLIHVFSFKSQQNKKKPLRSFNSIALISSLILCLILFYLDLIFTNSQSGFLGMTIGVAFFLFLIFFFWKKTSVFAPISRNIFLIILLFLILSFFAGTPLSALQKFTYQGLTERLPKNYQTTSKTQITGPALESNITSSGDIRKIVWQGAIDIWKDHPIFGTGVETFAFAYYLYRPAAHNMTSEWDYLYNKAHNEYLNYLSTTGIFGLGTYLSIIAVFFFVTIKNLFKQQPERLLVYGLLGAFASILFSNFFGFSVVIANIYLFIIPATVFFLLDLVQDGDNTAGAKYLGFFAGRQVNYVSKKKNEYFARNSAKDGMKDNAKEDESSLFQGLFITAIVFITLFLLIQLYNFWQADVAYALGANYDRVGRNEALYIERANVKLRQAVDLRGGEPVFQDELAINDTLLSLAFFQQKNATQAADFARQADTLSTQVVTQNPNNVVFWKNRVQVYSYLSELTLQALPTALDAIKHAQKLAPTDAKIAYNLGVLYNQTGHEKEAIDVLKKTIILKPDYRDAYYALGIIEHYNAVDKNNHVINPEYEKDATAAMHYILDHLSSTDQQAKDALKSWGEQ